MSVVNFLGMFSRVEYSAANTVMVSQVGVEALLAESGLSPSYLRNHFTIAAFQTVSSAEIPVIND